MTVQSALGEPLRAEIDVSNISSEEINSFSIRVAPPDAFTAAGLEYHAVLKSTLATLQRRPNGRAYIRLSSSVPINDPYVDMILEANSSSGRVARDYPMLFDPPIRSQSANNAAVAVAPSPMLAQVPMDSDMEPPPSYPSSPSYPSYPSYSSSYQPQAPSAPPSAYRIPIIDDSPRPSASLKTASDEGNGRSISEASPAAGAPAISISAGDAMADEFPDFSPTRTDSLQTTLTPEARPPSAATKRNKSAVVMRPQSRAVARLRHSNRVQAASTAEKANRTAAAPKVPTTLTTGANAASVVVKRGDNATKIAESLKPANVSLDEMLAALVQANPDAFVNNDPNRIRVGAVVKIPGTDSTSPPSASASSAAGGSGSTQSFTAESQNFDKYRRDLANQAPRAATEGASRKATGRIETQVAEKTPTATAPDKLTLSKGAVQGKSSEAAIADERASKETANRAADIHKNIADLQKLGASSPTLPALPASAPASSAASAAVPASAASAAASVALAASSAVSASSTASAAAMATASMPSSAPMLSAASAPASSSSAATASKPLSVSAPVPIEPSGFLLEDLWSAEDLTLPLAGIGTLLAGLAGFAFWRSRKRKEEMMADESSFIESRIPSDSFFGASGGQHVDTSQEEEHGNSSAMIYSPSQLNAIDDVDPVAEADVYLAYGRDVQAEEILREALLTNPGRIAIHTKLLEILSKRQDAEAFETAATQASQIVKKDSPEWAHICEMGQGFDSNNVLYQQGRPSAVVAAPAPMEMATPALQHPKHPMPDVDLDLDLDLDDAKSTAMPLFPAASTASLASSTASPAAPVVSNAPVASIPVPTSALDTMNMMDMMDMDFDLSTPMEAAPAPKPAPASKPVEEPIEQSLEEMFNLKFDELPNTFALPNANASHTPKASAVTSTAAAIPAKPDGDGMLLEFNLDDFQLPSSTPVATPTSAAGTMGARLEDPLETKLALAQEFVAIGDEFGAREILEEVIASANGALQAKARTALAKLG